MLAIRPIATHIDYVVYIKSSAWCPRATVTMLISCTCANTQNPIVSIVDLVFCNLLCEHELSRSRGRYHGGRRPSSDDSFHSPTVIPPSALDKPSITKRYHRRRTCSHTSPRRSLTMVTLHDTRFVECDGGMTVGLLKLSSPDGRRPP